MSPLAMLVCGFPLFFTMQDERKSIIQRLSEEEGVLRYRDFYNTDGIFFSFTIRRRS